MSDDGLIMKIDGEHGSFRIDRAPSGNGHLIQAFGRDWQDSYMHNLSRSDIVELALRTNEECSRIREWIGDGALAITDEAWDFATDDWATEKITGYARNQIAWGRVAFYANPTYVNVVVHVPSENHYIEIRGMPLGAVVRMREAWINEHGE